MFFYSILFQNVNWSFEYELTYCKEFYFAIFLEKNLVKINYSWNDEICK